MARNPPGRPPNRHKSIHVKLSAEPKLVLYLEDLIREQGFGASRPAVAKNLCWRAIEELISKGILDRRKGEVADKELETLD